ncbi:putative RNA polymerase ECF-subfamily sigma factor [Euzebya pacifica]|uniref:Putative RNA polymerase ECF-subfamily sigma factor n=1 Tax=Euzebya pacifica TaxID=1608957 RepID=A0A346XVJ6_9ACTN|nr:RNA polymerase sigma factor [Euzebya pacifica]AXV06243.1 putative RNA polymerase ECF-subfamily sigma factor [Euzebya pacifica]
MDDNDRLRALHDAHADDLVAYVTRRTASPDDAADVIAETFLVAWRRLDDVPPGHEARLWLFGVARRQLANSRRSTRRRTRLLGRLTDQLGPALAAAPPGSPPDSPVMEAISRLPERDREVLYLVAWEQLSPAEAAVVLGVSPDAARTRLHRARKRLEAELDIPASTPALEGTR